MIEVEFKCQECFKAFSSEKSLHGHLRAHKLKIETYYQKHFPRKDLFTGESISFKNSEQYLNSLFLNRKNCLDYIKNFPEEKRFNFLCHLFDIRRRQKNVEFAFSETELRSSILPSLIFLKKIGIDYKEICTHIGLKHKYVYSEPKSLTFLNDDLVILQDTREQLPLNFKNHKVIQSGLSFGDYTCQNKFNNVFIERKSAADFIGTFSKGLERFERELKRAEELKSHIFVLCELPLNKMLSFNFIDYIRRVTSVTPECVFHNVRYLLQKYPNVQFGFVDGRVQMVKTIEKIYSCNEDIRKYDIQYLIDLGLL